jgi:hypothetical protein
MITFIKIIIVTKRFNHLRNHLLLQIEKFQIQNVLIPTGRENFFGIEDLYTAIQLQFEGGDDFLSD